MMHHKNVNFSLHLYYIQFGSTIGDLGTFAVIVTTTEVLIIYILSNFN